MAGKVALPVATVAAMDRFLGLDVGTQGVKALLVDADGQIHASASAPLRTIDGLPPGHSEQHPEDWLAAIGRCLAELGGEPQLAAVRAVGVSGQQHGCVPVAADGSVLRPAKLWNDVSTARECAEIVAAVGGASALFARTGNALPPGFTAGKVRWLWRHEPEHYVRCAHVLLPHEYVDFVLTGAATSEAGDASGTGYFDVRARRYDEQVMAAVAPELARRVPRLLATGEPAGAVTPAAARRFGLRAGTLVAPGGGDNMMAALGAGAVRPGIAVLSLGTSGTVFACAREPVCDPGGEIAAFCDSVGQWLPLGCTMNATVASELARAALEIPLEQLDRIAGDAPAGCDGLLCLPFFTGERSPDLPDGTGCYVGLTPRTFTRAHLLRAAIEGATFALVRLLERLEALGCAVHELRLTGGGSRSRLWPAVVAAAAGRPVLLGVHPDAAALGAAAQAAWCWRRREEPALTAAAVVEPWLARTELQVLQPDAQEMAVYRQRRTAFERLLAALAPAFASL